MSPCPLWQNPGYEHPLVEQQLWQRKQLPLRVMMEPQKEQVGASPMSTSSLSRSAGWALVVDGRWSMVYGEEPADACATPDTPFSGRAGWSCADALIPGKSNCCWPVTNFCSSQRKM